MELTLYVNNSPPNYAYKNLSNAINIAANSCRMKDPMDILNPVIQISKARFGADAWVNHNQYNYCKIPAFGRSYFVKYVADLGEIVELQCNVDVLSTYIGSLINKSFEVERASNSNKGDSLLFADAERPLQINKRTEREKAQRLLIFPENTGGGYYLTVAGGGT